MSPLVGRPGVGGGGGVLGWGTFGRGDFWPISYTEKMENSIHSTIQNAINYSLYVNQSS